MKFRYCPDCGSELVLRTLGDEIDVPWCERCSKPWFPVFPIAIIALVWNDYGEVLLLRQNYISTSFCNLVSGYITPGENAEECARREIEEETGLRVDDLELVMTGWFAKKEMLMLGFFAHTSHRELKLSSEVDDAFWCQKDEVPQYLSTHPGSTSRQLADKFLKREKGSNPRKSQQE